MDHHQPTLRESDDDVQPVAADGQHIQGPGNGSPGSVELEAPLRVMSLHALAYCERLFYLEEVEELYVADDRVFAGRTLHEELRQAEEVDGEWTSLELSSDTLGLVGKVDALRRRDGALIPYEHKRGRARREGKTPVAWPSDALQVSAYAMLLEEQTARPVPEGRVRYHADKVTVRVPLDEPARQSVRDAIARARQLSESLARPPVAQNDRLCIRCSLAPVCLPEEERLAEDPDWQPIRMFPPDRERKTIYVMHPGARIGRAGDTLKINDLESGPRSFPVHEVESLVLQGYPQITTQALHFCARNDVGVHWLSPSGRYVAGLIVGPGRVQRRLRQYQALSDPGICVRLARRLAMAKVEGTLRYLLRISRGSDRQATGVDRAIDAIRQCLKRIAHADNCDTIRGHEGMAARTYFGVLPGLLRAEVPEAVRPAGRSRRPPKDRFNAVLSFGYALLHGRVLQAVLTVGLEPALGFLHTPRSAAHPLALDLMELFRVPLWDMPVIGSVNRLQWDAGADFDMAGGRVWLSESGRKKAIALFESRLTDTWRHPAIGYSLSYDRLIELEVRLLEKEWTGQPGLFARNRLR